MDVYNLTEILTLCTTIVLLLCHTPKVYHGQMNFRLTKAGRKAIGKRLRIARILAGLTVRGVAAELGASPTSVVQWEGGEVLPRPETRTRLAKLYKVPEKKLFAEEHARIDAMRELLDSA